MAQSCSILTEAWSLSPVQLLAVSLTGSVNSEMVVP